MLIILKYNDIHSHFYFLMLEVRNLSVSYRQKLAIENVSFQLYPGQVAGLLGANGAGKSTLIKAIVGLVPIANGGVYWQKRPVTRQLDKVAYVPQRSQLDWDYPITVERVVMMGRVASTGWFRRHSRSAKESVRHALQRVGMWHCRRSPIKELSGGQQQRVFLARAMVQDADLLLLDEPFNNVDSQTETIIFDLFAELKAQQKTLLVISHDLSETLDNYDRLLLIDQTLIATGTKTEVLTKENINQAYNKNAGDAFLPFNSTANANLVNRTSRI